MGEFGAQGRQEVHEERTVEILAELVEDKPVAEAAVIEVVLNLDDLVGPLEVAVHPEIDQVEPDY